MGDKTIAGGIGQAFRHTVDVEWGDCDEAGIVFYPNYFYWFDCTWQRLAKNAGFGQRLLRQRFGAVTPIVETSAKFISPVRYDETLNIRARIANWQEKRFQVNYQMSVIGKTVLEGHEVRAWALLGSDGALRGAPIHAEFKLQIEHSLGVRAEEEG